MLGSNTELRTGLVPEDCSSWASCVGGTRGAERGGVQSCRTFSVHDRPHTVNDEISTQDHRSQPGGRGSTSKSHDLLNLGRSVIPGFASGDESRSA